MASVRRTISLPPAVADRLDAQAQQAGVSFSTLIVEMAEREWSPLPYAAMIDDEHDLSLRVEELLARLAA